MRRQPPLLIYVIENTPIRICKHEGYLSHTRPIINLYVYDMIDFNGMVFMLK